MSILLPPLWGLKAMNEEHSGGLSRQVGTGEMTYNPYRGLRKTRCRKRFSLTHSRTMRN